MVSKSHKSRKTRKSLKSRKSRKMKRGGFSPLRSFRKWNTTRKATVQAIREMTLDKEEREPEYLMNLQNTKNLINRTNFPEFAHKISKNCSRGCKELDTYNLVISSIKSYKENLNNDSAGPIPSWEKKLILDTLKLLEEFRDHVDSIPPNFHFSDN
jgi:hypothetical protein